MYTSWFVLLLTCMMMFGNYYAYDIPAAINRQLQEYLGLDDADFAYDLNLYYSLYSLPNIILPFFAGTLLDSRYLYQTTCFLSTLTLVGHLVFASGIVAQSRAVSILGRFLFGLGGESLAVAQSRFTTRWFSGGVRSRNGSDKKERPDWLAFALGMNLAVGRFGSVVNDFVSPYFAVHWNQLDSETALWRMSGVHYALLMGALTCFVSTLCAWSLVWVDYTYMWSENKGDTPPRSEEEVEVEMSPIHAPPRKISFTSRRSSPRAPSRRQDSEHDLFHPEMSPLQQEPESPLALTATTLPHRNPFKRLVQRVGDLPFAFWLVCMIAMFSYGTVIPFNTIHSAFLQYRFHMDPVMSAQIMGVPDTISMILTPFTGSIVDRFGKRAHILFLCGLILVFVHTIFLNSYLHTWTWWNPIFPLVLLGLCYSFLLLVWSAIPLLVPASKVGTSFGIASCLLNSSLTITPLIVAHLLAGDPTFYNVELYFVGCGATCCLLSVYLYILDRTELGNILGR